MAKAATKSKPYVGRLRPGEDASDLRRPAAYALRELECIRRNLETETARALALADQLAETNRALAVVREDLAGLRDVLAEAERREEASR